MIIKRRGGNLKGVVVEGEHGKAMKRRNRRRKGRKRRVVDMKNTKRRAKANALRYLL